MAVKKRLTQKVAKEIFKKALGSASDANIENISDKRMDEYKMVLGMVTAHCSYEDDYTPGGRRVDGEHIKLSMWIHDVTVELYFDSDTLEIDIVYTREKHEKTREYTVVDFLYERNLMAVSKEGHLEEKF